MDGAWPQCLISSIMMRKLEAVFQLGPALTLKHSWSTLPSLSMTRMDGTSAMLTIHSNLIWWLYWANAIISLILGYLPRRAEAENSLLVKNDPSLWDSESFFFLSFLFRWKRNVKIKSWLMQAVIKKCLWRDAVVYLMNRCVFFALNWIAWLVQHNISLNWTGFWDKNCCTVIIYLSWKDCYSKLSWPTITQRASILFSW